MDYLVIASHLALMEETIQKQTELIQSLSDQLEGLKQGLIAEPSRNSRAVLVKDILELTEELGWTKHERKRYYWFTKGDRQIPLILENHSKDKKTKPGYLTTAGYKDNKMIWPNYKHWTKNDVNTYAKNIHTLNWVPFSVTGKPTSKNPKRNDPLYMSNQEIKTILKQFETIHQ